VTVKRHAPAALCRRSRSLIGCWTGPRSGPEALKERKYPCPEIEPQFLGNLILSLVTVLTGVFRLTKFGYGNDSRLSSWLWQ